MLNQFINYYKDTINGLKSSWSKILPWTLIWTLALVIPMHAHVAMYDQVSMGFSSGLYAMGVIPYFVVEVLLFLILSALQIFFTFSTAHTAMYDPDTSWFSCGVSNFRQLAKAFQIALPFQAAALLIIGIITGFNYLTDNSLGAVAFILSFILFAGGAIAAFQYSFVWFNAIDNPTRSVRDHFYESKSLLPKKHLKLIAVHAPALLVMFLLSMLVYSCDSQYNESRDIEVKMAQFTIQSIENSAKSDERFKQNLEHHAQSRFDRENFQAILSNQLYQKEIPEFQGDFDLYIEELARYGYGREKFEAHRDHRDVNQLANDYFNRPTPNPSCILGILLCLILISAFFSFSLVLHYVMYQKLKEGDKKEEIQEESNDTAPALATAEEKQPEPVAPETQRPQEIDELPDNFLSTLNAIDPSSSSLPKSSQNDSHDAANDSRLPSWNFTQPADNNSSFAPFLDFPVKHDSTPDPKLIEKTNAKLEQFRELGNFQKNALQPNEKSALNIRIHKNEPFPNKLKTVDVDEDIFNLSMSPFIRSSNDKKSDPYLTPIIPDDFQV